MVSIDGLGYRLSISLSALIWYAALASSTEAENHQSGISGVFSALTVPAGF